MEVKAFEILKPVSMKISIIGLDDGAFLLFEMDSLFGSRDFSLADPILIEASGVQNVGT